MIEQNKNAKACLNNIQIVRSLETEAKPRALGSAKIILKRLRPAVSLGLIGWLAFRTDWTKICDAFSQLHVDLWMAALGLYLGIQLVSGIRWMLLSRPLGFRQSATQFTGYYFVGMFFNLLLPTSVGGDVVRAFYLDGGKGQRLPAFLSVLVDRASGLMVLLMVACIGAIFCPIDLPGWISASVWAAAGCAIAGLLTLPLILKWTNRFARLRRLTYHSEIYLSHPRLLLFAGILSLFVQAANVVLVWIVGQAIEAPIPGAYYWILVPMVSLLTLMPLSLNGMGIREGSTVLFLAPLGVPGGTALCLAILWFSVVTVASLTGGIVYLMGYFPRPQVETDHGFECGNSDQGRTGQSKAAA